MNDRSDTNQDSFAVKVGLAEMLKGGAIMDVTNAEQARIAEEKAVEAEKKAKLAEENARDSDD